MARYDRIGRIPAPDRDGAFPGWLALRDLDGHEREPELGRRARLRFLALRPVRRILRRGLDADPDSFRLQLDAVRTEVERLPARDPERVQLLHYLDEIGGRVPGALSAATLGLGAAAERAGHQYAAEEFYLTGLEIARAHDSALDQARALRRLARVYRSRGEWDRAVDAAREAAALAEAGGETAQWALARDAEAAGLAGRGDVEEARRVLLAMAERGGRDGDDRARAVAAAGSCALELGQGRIDEALAHGRAAVELFGASDPHRNDVLLDLASGLRRLRLWTAAGVCYDAVARHATGVDHRAEATAERAVMAAEQGDREAFRRRRERLLASIDAEDLRVAALLHLRLGRGCFLVGDVDDSREHLRQAISTAREIGYPVVLRRADELLDALERGRPLRDTRTPLSASTATRELARDVERLLGREVVAAG